MSSSSGHWVQSEAPFDPNLAFFPGPLPQRHLDGSRNQVRALEVGWDGDGEKTENLLSCFWDSEHQKPEAWAGAGKGERERDCGREPGKRESRETMKQEDKNKRNE